MPRLFGVGHFFAFSASRIGKLLSNKIIRTLPSMALVFRQDADAIISRRHPHCEGKNDRCLNTISQRTGHLQKDTVRKIEYKLLACVVVMIEK